MLDLLEGIRVVSFNHFLLGPMGIQALGDLGADVISVENAEGAWQRHWAGGNVFPDGQSALHLCANRNKRSVAIDLKSPKGRELALRPILAHVPLGDLLAGDPVAHNVVGTKLADAIRYGEPGMYWIGLLDGVPAGIAVQQPAGGPLAVAPMPDWICTRELATIWMSSMAMN